MSRDAAIEAGARAASARVELDYDLLAEEEQARARELACAVIDAALPHLEPGLKAEALREAADLVYGDERAQGPHGHPLSIAAWLRERADRVERGDA